MKRIVRIHREGLRLIIVVFALLAVIVALISVHVEQAWIHYILYAIAIAFFYFVVRFFRVPNREIVKNDKAIYAPADGKIVVMEEIDEDCYFHDKRLQISIFMSPLNVHVNSYPISGKVVKSDYFPGEHLVAWYPKSSELNEHSSSCLQNKYGEVFFKQIAGTFARRIVCYSEPGNMENRGDQCGVIKFGSRIDMFLPLDADIRVKIGDKVKAVESVIAYLPE